MDRVCPLVQMFQPHKGASPNIVHNREYSPPLPLGRNFRSSIIIWFWALAGVITLCSWARHLTFMVPGLSTQVYMYLKYQIPANLMLEVTLQRTSIPSILNWKYMYSQLVHGTESSMRPDAIFCNLLPYMKQLQLVSRQPSLLLLASVRGNNTKRWPENTKYLYPLLFCQGYSDTARLELAEHNTHVQTVLPGRTCQVKHCSSSFH